MNDFRPGGATLATTTVELAISCRNLIDADVFSKSDPMVVLSVKEPGMVNWHEFGRTETIDNTLNPDFVKKFVMDYFFEERQQLKFDVYDIDSASRQLSDHDFLGTMECSLGEVVSAGKFTKPLNGPKRDSGHITIYAEELSANKEELQLQFSGVKLDKKDFFGKSDPFLAFYRVNERNEFIVVHRTEFIKKTLNPTWRPFTIPVRTLCGGDFNRTVLVRCFDWNRDGSEDLIGEFETNVEQLVSSPRGQKWTLRNPAKAKSKGAKYRGSGDVVLQSVAKQSVHSFMDFIQRGTQLNCTISIDFTASNGNPQDPSSLHYINPHQPNQYARALRAVGEIIQDYDSDKLFPVIGFGARLPPDGRVSHEFFVNGHPSDPHCEGISGVLDSYHRCIRNVQLYGPTNFAPTINHVARFARAQTNGSEYFILLIITDGVITDMALTKKAIVEAAVLPLSIIIVGVGNADFDAMEELDGDDVRVSYNGRPAARDIVQFVPFRNFIRGTGSNDMAISQARLAQEVLREIPDQFLSYMKVNRIQPGSWPGARPPLQQQTFAQSQPGRTGTGGPFGQSTSTSTGGGGEGGGMPNTSAWAVNPSTTSATNQQSSYPPGNASYNYPGDQSGGGSSVIGGGIKAPSPPPAYNDVFTEGGNPSNAPYPAFPPGDYSIKNQRAPYGNTQSAAPYASSGGNMW